ncbi:MAG: sigma 54-interacting transcriptional regulator [Candidatus Eisenbacteria bacterium]|uniref:Sigma 54-interacting transcriptional regulator n=1 Tax=Eiseniibacteriota bacterium TaxID=2212470 RepID=A0A849SMA8_UNCEI|nr:sigma 54-interacting transcriptional regulator [Candidatus Eisenbacteria bacterium]
MQLAIAINEKMGFRAFLGDAERSLAIVEWKAGRLREAARLATAAIGHHLDAGAKRRGAVAQLLHGLIRLHAGQLKEAEAEIVKASELYEVSDTSRLALLSQEYLGDVHLEQGEAVEALKFYDEVWPKAMALVPKGDIIAELRHRRAECYLLLGQRERAYEESLQGLKHCRELGDRYEEAATYRVLALSAAAVGRFAEAKSWFDQGFAFYEDIETPYEWGKLWLAYGDWLCGDHAGQFSDHRAALEAFRAARDHFEQMGAEGKLAAADARIQKLAPTLSPEPSSTDASRDRSHSGSGLSDSVREKPRPPRRPRASSETERRAARALELFGLVTRNRSVLDILEQCAKLAEGRSPMLVLGESGTGKELVAAGIHTISGRRGQFLPLNCAAIPPEVFESELFGHMAGSFTGALRDKIGIVEACDGGSMFLDEVGEMPLELQARVLRFLESGEFRRVGATRNTRADTRLVAATNRDRLALKNGEGFRADLYYRLAHGVITLPPLRQRGDDIALLIEHFLEQACSEAGREVKLADSAWARLGAHPWPGNVRELRSTIQRVVALARDGEVIDANGIELDDSDVPTNLLEETIVVEKRRIEEALRQAGGMKSEAARRLGLSRTTLLSKMKRYGMME